MFNNYNLSQFKILAFLIILFAPATLVFASNENENFNFQVNPILPSNQENKSLSYFDLRVVPGEEQKLILSITNNGKEQKKIKVTPVNASTNQSGDIIYGIPSDDNPEDKTLVHPFSSLIKEKSSIVEVSPGETKLTTFTLKVPKKKFKGVILGALSTTTVDDKKKVEGGIENKLQIVKAVILRESEEKITPQFIIGQITPTIVDFQKAVTINIQNSVPIVVDNAEIYVDIFKQNSKQKVASASQKNIRMAPNSNFDFPVMFNKDNLETDDYYAYIKIIYNKQIKEFKKKFTISKNDIYGLQNKSTQVPSSFIQSNYLFIGISILIIIIIIFFYIYYRKYKL